jgi:hypothetical protein
MATVQQPPFARKEHTVQKAIRRRAAALLLGMSILGPAAWGAERKPEADPRKAKAGPIVLLLGLWDRLSALWEEEGSYIDPDGARAIGPPPPPPNAQDNQEEGSFIDPNGAM